MRSPPKARRYRTVYGKVTAYCEHPDQAARWRLPDARLGAFDGRRVAGREPGCTTPASPLGRGPVPPCARVTDEPGVRWLTAPGELAERTHGHEASDGWVEQLEGVGRCAWDREDVSVMTLAPHAPEPYYSSVYPTLCKRGVVADSIRPVFAPFGRMVPMATGLARRCWVDHHASAGRSASYRLASPDPIHGGTHEPPIQRQSQPARRERRRAT